MTPRSGFKAREMIWLFLPVMLLGGVGWYFTGYPVKSDDGPWRVVVDEVKIVPITPREVSKGYDTKVAVKAHAVGNPPEVSGYSLDRPDSPNVMRLRLTQRRDGREQVIISAGQRREMLQINSGRRNDGTIVTAVMKLSAIPTSSEPIVLKAEVRGTQRYHGYSKRAPALIVRETPSLPVSIVVRKAGQKVSTPTASRYRPFIVKNIEISESRMTGTPVGDVLVSVNYEYEEPDAKDESRGVWPGESYLQDEKGRKYSRFRVTGSKWPSPMTVGTSGAPVGVTRDSRSGALIGDSRSGALIGDSRSGALRLYVPLSQVPQNAGKVTLHSSLSIDSCWPLPISVIVRDKNGKVPEPKSDTSKDNAEIPPIPASVP